MFGHGRSEAAADALFGQAPEKKELLLHRCGREKKLAPSVPEARVVGRTNLVKLSFLHARIAHARQVRERSRTGRYMYAHVCGKGGILHIHNIKLRWYSAAISRGIYVLVQVQESRRPPCVLHALHSCSIDILVRMVRPQGVQIEPEELHAELGVDGLYRWLELVAAFVSNSRQPTAPH